MGKKKKDKSALKKECCDKYLKKGEHKRCNRCPCLDMTPFQRRSRFLEMGIPIIKKAPETV
tara:strand:- start:297670 stop:297852 length:183 start_codon:yes stop_codon:yes gene_type:complete